MAEFQQIKSGNQRIQGRYDRLLATMQTLDINKEISPETVTIKDSASPAVLSRVPAAKTVAVAGIVGLLVGIGILLLVDQLDDRLNSFSELQEHFDEEILGQIPKDPSARNGTPAELVHSQDQRHAFVESYRNLRSSLMFLENSGAKPKVVLITSSIPNDGKTLTTSNLAITVAQSGSRVLLVDGDLRRGVLHQRFKVENSAGLNEAIAEGRPWQSLVQPTQAKNLSLLPRGATTMFSSELFLNPKAAALLRDAASQYDLVIVDSPPVMAADDATSLAPAVDGVLFVIRAQQTSARVARAALDLLYQRRIRVLGLVFNAVEANAAEYYYYKYKDYYATYPQK
jgi:capsular exopolysaccharide synthesis family protein